VYLALSNYNTEFVELALSAMNLVQREFLLYEWFRLGLQHCCLGLSDRNGSFYGRMCDSTFFV